MNEGGSRCLIYLIWTVLLHVQLTGAAESEVLAHVNTTVALPCRVDTKQCGALHSVKWYRDLARIYVFSHAGGIARAEGAAMNRMNLDYQENGVEALLKISPVQIEDEATYKCEITYLEVRENCDVVQIVKLMTLVEPTSVKIMSSDGSTLANSTILGPKDEGSNVEIICEATGGKPIPKVTWYNGSTEITRAQYDAVGNGTGVGTGTSKLKITLSRGDLNARFECRVESLALEEPIISWITADVHVRPTKMELTGVKSHVVQGTNVLLICDVEGARPAADVRWLNGTIPITNETLVQTYLENNKVETKVTEQRDGTFTTKSSLLFNASRFENGRTFHCYAENDVIRNYRETELHEALVLEVQYPPVITVSPLNLTVNESANPLLLCNYFANPQELRDIVWSKDDRNLTLIEDKHIGGTIENPSLSITSVSREDMGEYACFLKNSVGSQRSEDTVFLNVQFVPSVEVIMDNTSPIKAEDKANVTLACNVTEGNPSNLIKVRWYFNDDLMKELPECNYTSYDEDGNGEGSGGALCAVDPSFLSLERITRSFAGNYSCQGQNLAGWGPKSPPQELVVYYAPSPAKLRYSPSTVIKNGAVTLECLVDDPGMPENLTYLWYRGGHPIPEVKTYNWTIAPVTIETRSNFTCIAENEGGQSEPGMKFVEVLAPPSFIRNLQPYQGIIYTAQNISLTCRVECSPLCAIVWSKDSRKLDTNNDPLYYVETTVHPANTYKNDFESIESTLVWNLTAWPGKQLNRSAPNSHYTCESLANGVGPGVNSSIEIAIDFAPEDVQVIPSEIKVIEGHVPDPAKCTGKGRPALSFAWRRNQSNEVLSKTDTLQLGPMLRQNGGGYICEASNKHGSSSTMVNFTVEYSPTCTISVSEVQGKSALLCTATAEPQDVNFSWTVREVNDSSAEFPTIVHQGLNSYLVLDTSITSFRTYVCMANNTIGSGVCKRGVAGNIPWWKGLNEERMIIIIASAIALILCVIIICIVIIIICRRKRSNTKSTASPSSAGDKARLQSAPPSSGLADPTNDPDKGFYENLPFHGIQNPPNKNAFYTLTAPHLRQMNSHLPSQYSATIPHPKNAKLAPRMLFPEQQLPKSKSFSSKAKQKKHFQIPLQKCHSFRFQTAESYFQPIKNIHEENLMKNGYVSDYAEGGHCSGRHHKHEKYKHKTKGPLVLRRGSDYHESLQFQENVQNSVQLQYPQPMLGHSPHATNKPNGVVYADLDMPSGNKKSSRHNVCPPAKSKHNKPKTKTEYATLQFNDVGQEIDV